MNFYRRFRRRVLIFLVALTDDFMDETCITCKRTYLVQANTERPAAIQCPECETKSFTKWLNAIERREQERKGAA